MVQYGKTTSRIAPRLILRGVSPQDSNPNTQTPKHSNILIPVGSVPTGFWEFWPCSLLEISLGMSLRDFAKTEKFRFS